MCSVSLPAEDGTVSIAADHLPGYGAPSPLGYSPMTPGSHSDSPFTPPTPGASLDISCKSEYYSPDIEVAIKNTHKNPGQTSVICDVITPVFSNALNPPKISALDMISQFF